MKKVIFFLLLLFSIHFWGFIYIPIKIYNVTNAIALFIMGISFIRTLHKDGLHFKNAIVLFFIGIFINIISAYINQGQAPLETFLSFGTSYFFILFYFAMHYISPSKKLVENIIIIFAILYSLFYIFQVLSYPDLIFNSIMLEDRGTIRFTIEGKGFLILAYFLLLNRYFFNRRLINLLLVFGFFIILLMSGYRTHALASFLLSILMFIKLGKYSIKNFIVMVAFVLFILGLFQFPATSKILDEMISSSIDQKAEGTENIRIKELYYYLKIYPQNKSYFFMGGGLPGSESSYARSMEIIQSKYQFYWVDIGLIGFYIVIGGITLLGLIWYTIKAIFIKVEQNNLYLNFFFAYLLIVSFTTMEIYRPGIFAVEAIALYLIDIVVKEHQNDAY